MEGNEGRMTKGRKQRRKIEEEEIAKTRVDNVLFAIVAVFFCRFVSYGTVDPSYLTS